MNMSRKQRSAQSAAWSLSRKIAACGQTTIDKMSGPQLRQSGKTQISMDLFSFAFLQTTAMSNILSPVAKRLKRYRSLFKFKYTEYVHAND